jgi:hypothetical protein
MSEQALMRLFNLWIMLNSTYLLAARTTLLAYSYVGLLLKVFIILIGELKFLSYELVSILKVMSHNIQKDTNIQNR